MGFPVPKVTPTVAEIIEQLSSAAAFPEGVSGPIEVGHTHTSLLLFTKERVYKIKKPVDFGFLDFTTLERRKHFCEEEVRLNRRLTDIHLGVVPITREGDGSLRMEGEGTPVEWAVKMARLPHHRMLDVLLEEGEVDNDTMSRLAELLAEFHARCATGEGVDEWGSMAVLLQNHEENMEQTQAFIHEKDERTGLITERAHRFLDERMHRFLAENAELIAGRQAAGRIRDGHGDLHAANICLLSEPDPKIVIYDCIEFTPRFRCSDVVADIAFLTMDLDLRGFRGFASYFERAYAKAASDDDLDALMAYYKSYRACVRGKVGGMQAADPDIADRDREAIRAEAERHFQLAVSYWLEPVVILMCGLPAAGKSWLARELAKPFEARILRSDVVRKRLAGIDPEGHHPVAYESGIYSPEHTQRTYDALIEQMEETIDNSRSVVVDAAFLGDDKRTRFFEHARSRGARAVIAWVECPEEVVERRMAERSEDPTVVSDADLSIYEQARTRMEPPSDGRLPWVKVVSGGDDRRAVDRVIDGLIEQLDVAP